LRRAASPRFVVRDSMRSLTGELSVIAIRGARAASEAK
jgi:hypothetical protein